MGARNMAVASRSILTQSGVTSVQSRAITQPSIAAAGREIRSLSMMAGPNAEFMAEDLLLDAGLPARQNCRVPEGFRADSCDFP